MNLHIDADLSVKLGLTQECFGSFFATHGSTGAARPPGDAVSGHHVQEMPLSPEPGHGGRRDGIDVSLSNWYRRFRRVWYNRWAGTQSGVRCPLLELEGLPKEVILTSVFTLTEYLSRCMKIFELCDFSWLRSWGRRVSKFNICFTGYNVAYFLLIFENILHFPTKNTPGILSFELRNIKTTCKLKRAKWWC